MKMQAGRLYATAKALKESEKTEWKDKILSSMNIQSETTFRMPFEALVLAVYSCFDKNYNMPDLKAIAYGAGKMGEKYIPIMAEKIEFYEIWDAYSDKKKIGVNSVIKPKRNENQWDFSIPIIVFIDDKAVRYEVMSFYRKKGYGNLFYFRDYLKLLDYFCDFRQVEATISHKAKEIVDQFYQQYQVMESPYFPVLFSIFNRDLMEKRIHIKNTKWNKEDLKSRLSRIITIDKIPENCWEDAAEILSNPQLTNQFQLAYSMELVLEKLLSNHVKTLERPMRMADDRPYDGFAVTVVLNELLMYLFEDYQTGLDLVRSFRTIAESYVPILASECYFLLQCGNYTEALETAREAMRKEPNGLLANETFYQVACECKSHGIYVEEPIPEYDLSERFCWSGLNFVWCGGFDNQTGMAEFSPCFRPLQCAARPEGEFWTGEDWKEFRKSVTDGSFRYCQKSQCANIVAGWLPKKSECKEESMKRILDGDLSVIPPIEELHFSYDGHCNLKCPSCRLEFQTNTQEQNKKLDELYEKNLKPYMGQAKHLTLSGCGEAMLSPHSRKVLQSFSRESNPELAVEIRTNATTINARSWDLLGSGKEVIRHITASIDASTKGLFEKLRYPAKWETVLENLEFIRSLRNSGQIEMFEFHVVIQKENIDQLCDLAKMAMRYDADAITYSRLINWREMSEEEYQEINPFWQDHPLHEKLMQELKALEKLREDIEEGNYGLAKGRKKFYINIHFSPDPNSTYDEIRTGRLKIR
ncbi:radical SAM protein [Candidatus Ventrimonas sp. KK005]